MITRPLAGLSATALVAGLLLAPPATAVPAHTVTDGCVDSVPEPGTTDPVSICYSLFQPGGSSKVKPVPMVLHGHGWGGSRTTDPAGFQQWLDNGYGVLSFDQRGFGESGGKAHIMHPDIEGRDVQRIVDVVGSLDWVQKDGPGDPRLGAIGGSYGGGYQFAGAFANLRTYGEPLFDALAPEITWNDLTDSLAPEGVVRTEWALALSAVAAPTDALETSVYQSLVEGAATGEWPDGSGPTQADIDSYMEKNGPTWHVGQGRRLDIPVLFGQGTTDTLFPLQQAFENWQTALTESARARSLFVAYNGGHVLPGVFPQTVSGTSDPCSAQLGGGSFRALTLRFFDEVLKQKSPTLTGYGEYHLATMGNTCITVSSVAADTSYDIGAVVSTTAAGTPTYTPVADGPITVAGTPYLTGSLTTFGLNNRAFYGLAIGTNPSDAKLVQGNVLPLNEPAQVSGVERTVALPSGAVEVPEGKKLFLLATPVSDMFGGMGSRTPGVIIINDAFVHLPFTF